MAPNGSTPRGGRGIFRPRLGQLNPAFAAAHGISPVNSPSAVPKKKENDDDEAVVTIEKENGKVVHELPISPPPVYEPEQATATKSTEGLSRVEQAIARARTTGKLQASDVDLESPLPRILFEFPSLADSVDMSLDTNPGKLKPWESHVAETLVLVDFSDNEGITEFPQLDNSNNNHTTPNSVEWFRSIQIFRARRCKLQSFPLADTLRESWSQLITLDLTNNELKGEFPLVHLPSTIRELDVSGNSLRSLKSQKDPSSSIELPQLMSLDISENDMASSGIPPVMHLPILQRLNCGNNKIYNLQFILKAISSSEKSLTTLSAPNCMLSDLDGEKPIDLTTFVAMLSVDLSGNSLCRMPKIAPSVQRLNVNENVIQSIDGMLEEDDKGELKSSSLVVLQIQRNKLTTLDPMTVSKLTELNRLDLQYNSIKDIPVELGMLDNLQQMFLEGNHLLSLRSSGVRCDLKDTSAILTRLRNRAKTNSEPVCTRTNSLDDNSVSSTQSSTASGSTKKSLQHHYIQAINVEVGGMLDSLLVGTKTINFSGKHAPMLPFRLLEELRTSSPEIVQRIERLNVSKNQLQSIEDDWITLLPQLTTLEAQDNRLASLPATIREVSFTHLNLARNKLSSSAIQSSVLCLSPKNNFITDSLQVLDLSSNSLDSFPPDLLRHFKSLRNLNLSRNRITSLKNVADAPFPPSCPTLEHLNLSENRIEDLGGDDFPLMLRVGCPNLQSLKLENNELQKVPMTLGLLENLKVMELRGNPQRLIRYEILDKSTNHLLQYMRNRMTSKTKQQATARMRELESMLASGAASSESETATLADTKDSTTNSSNDCDANIQCPVATANDGGNGKKQPSPRTEVCSPSSKKTSQQEAISPIPPPPPPPPKVATPKAVEITSPANRAKGATAPSPFQSRIPTPKTRQGLALGRGAMRSPTAATSSSRTTTPTSATKARATSKPTATKTTASAASPSTKLAVTSPLLEELEKSIAELATDLDRPGLSEPKRYAIKKKLQMERSKRLREERRLKQEKDRNSRTHSADQCVSFLR